VFNDDVVGSVRPEERKNYEPSAVWRIMLWRRDDGEKTWILLPSKIVCSTQSFEWETVTRGSVRMEKIW